MSELVVLASTTPAEMSSARRATIAETRTLAGAMIGNVVSASTILTFTLGIFISSFNHDYGWSRADTSWSMTWFTIVVFFGAPLVGRVADKLSPGRVAATSMLAFGAALLAVPHVIHSVQTLWFAYFALAVLGLGTLPVVTNKPVVAAFSKSRALGIAVALGGVGVGGFAAPRFVAFLIERGGWQLGFTGLGWVCIAVAPIVWVMLGERKKAQEGIAASGTLSAGLSFREASRVPAFWTLCMIGVLGGLGMSGPAAHLIPYLRDHGISLSEASALASYIGISSIVGRLLTGFVLDRSKGPVPAMPLLLVGALGSALLVLFGVKLAAIAAILVGFSIGSEIDLLAYFTSRFFGLRAQGAVFGLAYGMMALGASVGPVVLGALRDSRGDYALGFLLSSAALAAAGFLCALLGPYRYRADMSDDV